MNDRARFRGEIVSLVLLGYLGLAFGVRDLYPFSTFAMFAAGSGPRASRVLARGSDGSVRAVERLIGWRCDRPVRLEHDACAAFAPFSAIDYRDRAAAEWLETHAGDGAGTSVSIDLVRRIWRLDAGSGPPPFDDCLLARCQAVPR